MRNAKSTCGHFYDNDDNGHLVARLEPCEVEVCDRVADTFGGDTDASASFLCRGTVAPDDDDNGYNGSVAPLRLKDLDLLVAIGGATCLVNGLLEAVLASSAVLPDPLPWSVPQHFSGGNLIS